MRVRAPQHITLINVRRGTYGRKQMLWTREDYIAHMCGEYTGKELFCEPFGLLVGLENEWRLQGASEDEINLSAFGWDGVPVPAYETVCECGAVSGISPKIIEDTPAYTLKIDGYGRKTKLIKSTASIPLPLEYPVKDFDDWLKIKHWYEFSESRINAERLEDAKKLRQNGHLIVQRIPGGFDEPRQLLGEEGLCLAFYEQPELIFDMLSTITQTSLRVLERILDAVQIDCLFVHEDMAGKSGPLAGPAQIVEFIKPYYRAVWGEVSRRGCRLFSQDSDGNMNPVMDAILDCGINSFHPCEPAAGMDIVEMRKKYGARVSLKGGIDKHVLKGSKNDILRELEYKMCKETLRGGVAFGLDHRIPNGVPIENYRFYAEKGREILGLPYSGKAPHIRMAF